MKKFKRFFALSVVVLLVLLYLSTLIFAIMGNERSVGLFKASVYATVVIPVLIYAYTMIYRFARTKNTGSDSGSASSPDKTSSHESKKR